MLTFCQISGTVARRAYYILTVNSKVIQEAVVETLNNLLFKLPHCVDMLAFSDHQLERKNKEREGCVCVCAGGGGVQMSEI